MKLRHMLVLATFTIVTAALASPLEPADQVLNFKNQRGSTMQLRLYASTAGETTGSIEGQFTTAVGNCKPDIGKPMPVTGFYNYNVIAISINFPECKQVISMTGYLLNSNSEFHTLWFDSSASPDPQKQDWNSNLIGSDDYAAYVPRS